MIQRYLPIMGCVWVLSLASPAAQTGGNLAEHLSELDISVVQRPSEGEEMLERVVREGIREADRKSTAEWMSISTREEWERYRDRKIAHLRDSLGTFPAILGPPDTYVTGGLKGEGFRVENLVFESRPGIWVTANLYVPEPEKDSMPGVMICHSHHNPKTQGELQDMGMTWARWGCLTLVMDQLGHGERRDHPFGSEEDYQAAFPLGRQDYYFRYNLGIQLHLIGESLVGWMVWDLKRGLDLLLTREGIDRNRLILLGAVAGGGDPAAITAALDERITAAVPLNFGGPQGYHPYPLPEDAEESFNYAGSGSWESTRNLKWSCRDGFLPWVIVGGIAPRYLVYAHEFSWDRERDPVWRRLLRLYGDLYNVPDRLDYSHGFGVVRKRPPEASHCNNIGPVQRERIHLALRRWFEIDGSLDKEYSKRLDPEDLLCMSAEWKRKLSPLHLYEKAEELARSRLCQARRDLRELSAEARLQQLRRQWKSVLGPSDPVDDVTVVYMKETVENGIRMLRLVLKGAPKPGHSEILIPLIILRSSGFSLPAPAVVCVSQQGKSTFLRKRVTGIASLLANDLAVCLVDVRGTGETGSIKERGRTSQDTEISSSLLMLGRSLVGERLGDLRTVLKFLRTRPEIDRERMLIWGDSLRQPNSAGEDLRVPMGIDSKPRVSEPLGGLLALLTALYEPDLRAVYVHGGLISFESVLASPFCYLPHDVVIPGVISTGDLPSLVEALDQGTVRLEALVDGLNRKLPKEKFVELYPGISTGVEMADSAEEDSAEGIAWMLQRVLREQVTVP